MGTGGELVLAVVLVVLGVRLSAFFSGAETGFYRVSLLRQSIDAKRGNRDAARVLRFAKDPAAFLSTTLVGNNLANYITTIGIGLGASCFVAERLPAVEIVSTLLVSPVLFIFGELMPKTLYYRAPDSLLRKNSAFFLFFYYLLFPLCFPLMLLARLLQKRTTARPEDVEFVFGRKRLLEVLALGHEQGVLADIQRRIGNGLLFSGQEPVVKAMTPCDRVLGLPDTADKKEILAFARRYALSTVVLRRAKEQTCDWYGYVRVVDVAVRDEPLEQLIHRMPRLDFKTTKLEALIQLRQTGKLHGVVEENGRALGIVNERGLTEQLMRTSPRTPF